ncbi:Methylated-DNA--protein-cysteine methyltransferase Ogt [Helicobacter ailurogastricus]|uniref:methylated-DNA--[protein]-cysteine S-methyltransferase n=1 Tax=Helicobacter ailurogastricus TaxID=1578720 RepID=UPI00244D8482|nr:methylated-DNA--[protein]-cysteine S-methyltransferase [Helicobacter ailurogastricus]GMB90225.1 Methylated-DNA--protein-cysteine methyltransferase Ogt [Helicobacter ailurogastricus]
MILAFFKPPKSFPSPYLALRTDSKGLVSVDFVTQRQSVLKPDALMQAVLESLESYFRGQLFSFNLPLSLSASPFSLQVWQALQNIPYAKTCTYQEIAHAINNPKACRAVGNANHNNPCPIVIPCHRVVLKSGNLGGYGGGVGIKEWLLEHEQRHKR